jgi:NADPH:quinone reductase-like Zn-dependent oxidoreductase
MKAIQYTGYGKSNVLQLNDIEKPELKEDEVLIKISATTVNPLDIKIRSGQMQHLMPVRFPYIPGMDIAGTVERIGSQVTRFEVGDQVYAATTRGGTYAECIALDTDLVAKVPQNITLSEAAAVAIPLVTAYTFLIEEAKVQRGQRILIQGAAGSVGQVMAQMAKVLGAYVIEGLDLLKRLGADEIIDYKNQDSIKLVRDADLVIDLVGGDTQTRSFDVLKTGGLLLSGVMPPSGELAQKFGVHARFADGQPSYQSLEFGTGLVEQGKIKPRIAKVLKLEEATAQDLVSAGGLNGKIVLTVHG